MPTKTEMAFRFSALELFAQRKRVSFWTLTFIDAHGIDEAHRCFDNLNRACRRKFPAWYGLRVSEIHPGGHGLHFHLLLGGYLPIEEFKRVARRFGFGRTSVCEADEGSINYLCKYLRKPQPALGARRRWGFIGGFKGSRVRDILVQSTLAENCRRVRQALGLWGPSLYAEVARLTMQYGHCLDWPTFPELKPLPEMTPPDVGIPQTVYPQIKKLRLRSEETGEWHTHVLVSKVTTPF